MIGHLRFSHSAPEISSRGPPQGSVELLHLQNPVRFERTGPGPQSATGVGDSPGFCSVFTDPWGGPAGLASGHSVVGVDVDGNRSSDAAA